MPLEYTKYQDVAADPEELGLLLETKIEHLIDLILRITALYKPLYLLSDKELHALHMYLEETL